MVATLVQRYAHSARHTKNTLLGALCISSTPTLGIKDTVDRTFGAEVCAFRVSQKKNTQFLALCISNTPILRIQRHFRWPLGNRRMRIWRAASETHFFGIVHFKQNCTRYQKTLSVASFVLGCARSARHTRITQSLASCISNTPILRIQKPFCWQFGGRGTCGQRAAPKTYIFGIVHFKHTHTRYPKTPLIAILVQRHVRSARHTKNTQSLASCISNTPILGI